jgi:hypothetical protein
VPEVESDKEEDEKVNDFSKDKMIKPVKPKGKAKEAATKKKKWLDEARDIKWYYVQRLDSSECTLNIARLESKFCFSGSAA